MTARAVGQAGQSGKRTGGGRRYWTSVASPSFSGGFCEDKKGRCEDLAGQAGTRFRAVINGEPTAYGTVPGERQ